MTIDLDIKYQALVCYTQFNQSLRRVSTLYGVAKSTLSNWVRANKAIPKKKVNSRRNPPKHRPTTLEFQAVLASSIQFYTLRSMQQHIMDVTGKPRSLSSVHRYKTAIGMTWKRLSKMVDPKTADVARVRQVNQAVREVDTVSVDETGFYVTDRPRYAHSTKGQRARLLTLPPSKGTRKCSALVAIGRKGMIDFELIEGACNQHIFSAFIERLDAPAGSKVILDNASFHRTKRVLAALDRKAFVPVFTPAYSPWCNPIELAFSKVKTLDRHATADDSSLDTFDGRILGSLAMVDPKDCVGYFDHVEHLTTAFETAI